MLTITFSTTVTMFGTQQVLSHFLFSEWLLQFTQHRNRLFRDLTHPLVPCAFLKREIFYYFLNFIQSCLPVQVFYLQGQFCSVMSSV